MDVMIHKEYTEQIYFLYPLIKKNTYHISLCIMCTFWQASLGKKQKQNDKSAKKGIRNHGENESRQQRHHGKFIIVRMHCADYVLVFSPKTTVTC